MGMTTNLEPFYDTKQSLVQQTLPSYPEVNLNGDIIRTPMDMTLRTTPLTSTKMVSVHSVTRGREIFKGRKS